MTNDHHVSAIANFSVARLPEIHFGEGLIETLPELIQQFGQRVLVLTGKQAFVNTPHWARLTDLLNELGVVWSWEQVNGEPSPQLVDSIVGQYHDSNMDVVVGIGGGSVLDAAKAIAGMLRMGTSVMDHLEGVGRGLPYTGPAAPLIAVPTTAGTGSEATKNAVLSQQGADGFKKSFRDNQLVADVALVDPNLLASCPKSLIAANGMDAFTQLLESYVSTNASAFTDALAWDGIESFYRGFWAAWEPDHPDAAAGYSQLAYASLTSGITLAQAGLGSVHGLASPLGAFFPIPHGVVCGTLLAEATAVNIQALLDRAPDSPALGRYARVGRLLSGEATLPERAACDSWITTLRDWVEKLALPRLSAYGMTMDDLDRVCVNARGGSMKTNPLVVTDDELKTILTARL